MALNLEVGKYYERRDGEKARVLATDDPLNPDTSYPVAVQWRNGTYTVTRDGKAYSDSETQADLIGEWREKMTYCAVMVKSAGGVYVSCCSSAAEARKAYGNNIVAIGEEVTITEGEGMEDAVGQ
jgi:hypothetical protein